MRKTDVPMAATAIIWTVLLWTGVDGLRDIATRAVPGYPATGQIILYAAIPALALLCLTTSVYLSRTRRWFHDLYPVVVLAAGFAILPVILVWGGGV